MAGVEGQLHELAVVLDAGENAEYVLLIRALAAPDSGG